jgi:hypothetical protein
MVTVWVSPVGTATALDLTMLGVVLSGILNQTLSLSGLAENELARLTPHWLASRVLGVIVPALSTEPLTDAMVLAAVEQVLLLVMSLGRIRQVSVGLLVEIDVV